jgi:hypothetical protein
MQISRVWTFVSTIAPSFVACPFAFADSTARPNGGKFNDAHCNGAMMYCLADRFKSFTTLNSVDWGEITRWECFDKNIKDDNYCELFSGRGKQGRVLHQELNICHSVVGVFLAHLFALRGLLVDHGWCHPRPGGGVARWLLATKEEHVQLTEQPICSNSNSPNGGFLYQASCCLLNVVPTGGSYVLKR